MNVKKININQTGPTYNILSDSGYLYAGIATPNTNPGTPDGLVFYIATQPGVYPNFNYSEVTNEALILYNNND